MADESRAIQNLLDDIMNARYGEQVRTAIHDSIEKCYDDVSADRTIAAEAASEATSAAASANAAASLAVEKAQSADTAASSAMSAYSEAMSAASSANIAAAAASTAANSASTQAISASIAAASARTAVTAASTAASLAASWAAAASTAKALADAAASSANEAASRANTAATSTATAIADCNIARTETIAATAAASVAISRATAAAVMIEDMTVTSEEVGADSNIDAIITNESGHKNIHFKLKQGPVGPGYIIKGQAYEDVSDLIAAITNPEIGDQYNVGSAPPYHVWRYTGVETSYSGWEDQGAIGVSFSDLTTAEINTLWDGTAIVSTDSKYINHTGLLHLIVNKIKAALNGKVSTVSGKGLSTNDFTTEYKDQIDTNASDIATLNYTKVTIESGKGLSTNDYTTAEKNKLASISPSDSNPLMDGAATAGSSTSYSRADHRHPRDTNQILYFTNQTVSAASSAQIALIEDSRITTDSVVLSCNFADEKYVRSDIEWESGAGSIAFTGTVTAVTTMDVVLGRKGN